LAGLLRRSILPITLAVCCFATPLLANDTVREAQSLLNSLGYDAGPVDGAAGKRTMAAMTQFLDGKGTAFDGSIDEQELGILRSSAADYEVVLRSPGRILPIGDKMCAGLSVGRFKASRQSTSNFPPVLKFDDSESIGSSVQKDSANAFEQALLVNAAAAAGGNQEAAAFARLILLQWANANAGLRTAVDKRYLGAGNAEAYDAKAAAPVLDMENAAQLGAAGLTALEMLGDHLSASERQTVREWALQLVTKFDSSKGLLDGSVNGVFILNSYPRLLGAIAEGDAAFYKRYVESAYDLFRARIDKHGAILKNANRGDRALHYQSIGLLSALALFELVENQGSKIPADVEAAVHRAVTFMLDADRDNSVILPYAKMGFNNPGKGDRPERTYRTNAEHYWWMVAYIARYPDTENATRLRAFLGHNDTGEKVASNIMPATWTAYPINCFVSFDLSPKRVEEAIAYVDAKYPKVIAPRHGGRKMGKPRTKGAQPISFDSTSIVLESSKPNFELFDIRTVGLKIGNAPSPVQTFSIFADFGGGADDLGNLTLLRIVGRKASLRGEKSVSANFLPCGQVAAMEDSFRLHIGEHRESNACILNKMDSADRTAWASILDGLESIINDGDPDRDEDRARLKELYDYMVY
jgi:hypothetical protein